MTINEGQRTGMDADGYQQGQQQPRQCQLPTSPTALHVDITNDGNDDDSSSSNNKNSILDHIEDVKNTIKNKKSNSNSNSNSSISILLEKTPEHQIGSVQNGRQPQNPG
mmetsp:Transcript_22854/g.34310  ORF Transcript_22854/g.34310 Transcript_22854/m.34310 type:complete len:109 (-) Transcript_22854:116-442(-)